jgi:hypothetical protein
MQEEIRLTLYYREGCHLCEQMLQGLRDFGAAPLFRLELVDVDSDPELLLRYDEWVPVLCMGEREICHHRLDVQALGRVLSEAADDKLSPTQ